MEFPHVRLNQKVHTCSSSGGSSTSSDKRSVNHSFCSHNGATKINERLSKAELSITPANERCNQTDGPKDAEKHPASKPLGLEQGRCTEAPWHSPE